MRTLGFALAAVFGLAACGDDDSTTTDQGGAETSTAVEGTDAEESSPGEEGSSGAAASIDPTTMPEPATATVEVDGQLFEYAPPDPNDTRLFTCDLAADRVTVNMQTPDGHDLLVQVSALDTGEWGGSIVAKSRDSDRNYQGEGPYAADSVAVEPPYLAVSVPFSYYTLDDPANFTDVGDASISVTCP